MNCAGRFGWTVAADARLRVTLKFAQGEVDGFAMRLAHAIIATDQRCKRDGLGRGERGVPTCAMLYGSDGLTIGPGVLLNRAMDDQAARRS